MVKNCDTQQNFFYSGGTAALNKPMEDFGDDDRALINETRNSVSNFKFLLWQYVCS